MRLVVNQLCIWTPPSQKLISVGSRIIYVELPHVQSMWLSRTNGAALLPGLLLPSFRHVELNPIHCGRSLCWLFMWLQEHPNSEVYGECASPEDLAGTKLSELSFSQLGCEGTNKLLIWIQCLLIPSRTLLPLSHWTLELCMITFFL